MVATPIGNLGDMSQRAVATLRAVTLIAAEDTRHSRHLLHHFGVATPTVSLHAVNEQDRAEALLQRLLSGKDVAIVSDAGTPLISDPGFALVRVARAAGVTVVPVPGPSALTCALSVAGLPTDRFVFEGFLPAKAGLRRRRLRELAEEPRTLVLYEAPHRVLHTLEDLAAIFGEQRQAVLARELTKAFETVRSGTLAELVAWVGQDRDQQRGELVILLHGAAPGAEEAAVEGKRVLRILLAELPVRQAASLAAQITGAGRNELYQLALALQRGDA